MALNSSSFDLSSPWGIALTWALAGGRLFGHQLTLRLRLPNQPGEISSSRVDEPITDLFLGYRY